MEGRIKILLGVLGVLLLLTLWHYLGPDDSPEVTAGAEGGPPSVGVLPGGRRATDGKKPVEFVEELRVADLNGTPRNYTPGRNPWRFVEPPPPPPVKPPQPSKADLERMRQEQERLARERAALLAQRQAEAAIPKPPPFTMSYLGSFGPPERRIAVFSDGKTIYNAQEGEVLGGQFIVAHIGFESVDIQFVNFPGVPAQRLAVGAPSR